MKLRFYLDTSVWGGIGDPEFNVETELFFRLAKKNTVVFLYSDLVERELAAGAPTDVMKNYLSLAAYTEKIEITDEIRGLAEAYVKEGVVGKTSLKDCIHIAAAAVHKADVLVSWNFKHIVNVSRVKGYNTINALLGYPTLKIHSPKEILNYETKDEF